MYRINKRIVMDAAPSLSAIAGNIRSTLLCGNNSTSGYVITDRLNQGAIGKTVMLNMSVPGATGSITSNSSNLRGVAFKVLNASRAWYEDEHGEIREGGRYELERDDVSTVLHLLSETEPANSAPLKIMLTQAPVTFLKKYPNTYTGSKLALGGKLLKHSKIYGKTIKLLVTDGASADARVLDSSDIIGTAENTNILFKRMEEIANGDIKASNVRIRIGFSKEEVNKLRNSFRAASLYNTIEDRVMYETGKLFFSIGSSTLTFNACDDSGFISDANDLGLGTITEYGELDVVDEAGFVRRLMYNGNIYDLPVLDISPVATGYEDEIFKIKQLSNLSQGDIAAALLSLVTNIVGDMSVAAAPVTGGIAAAMRNLELIPPEYKVSFSYALFQMSGLKTLGNTILNMKNKERDASVLFNDVTPVYGCYYANDYALQPLQQLTSSAYSYRQNGVNLPPSGTTLRQMYDAVNPAASTNDGANMLEFRGYIRHYLFQNSAVPANLYDPLNDFLQSGFSFIF